MKTEKERQKTEAPFLDRSGDCNLTLKDPFISESCVEIKIELNFYFHTFLWCLKRFYECENKNLT